MHRLLVLSALAAAILTAPAFAGAGATVPHAPAIGTAISVQQGGRTAAAVDLTLLTLPRDGKSVAQS